MAGDAIRSLLALVRAQADHREQWADQGDATHQRHERETVALMRKRADDASEELRVLLRGRGK